MMEVTMSSDCIRMLLIGAGFMGETHVEAAAELENVKFVGIVDSNSERAEEFGKKHKLECFDNLEQAIEKLNPDAVDICTPTTTHLPIIRLCAEKRVHCLCEKPVSLSIEDAREIGKIDSADCRIMVAQVLRFWPEYEYALDVAQSKKYGDIISIDCKRFCSPPDWNDWMTLPDKGGGAVIDLQIHDLDFIMDVLGPPRAINSKGSLFNGAYNTVYNSLDYGSGISVCSEGSMVIPQSYPFRMWYRIVFANATLEFDFWRSKGERLMVCPAEGDMFNPELPATDAYAGEIAYFARQLLADEPFDLCPLQSSISALELCLASKLSCETGSAVDFLGVS